MIRRSFFASFSGAVAFAGGTGSFLRSPVRAQDWQHWRGPARQGIADEELPEEFDPEEMVWRAKVGLGFSSLAIRGERLLTMGHDGEKSETLWCLDAGTGEVIWSNNWEAPLLPNLHEGGPAATPAIAGDAVFSLGKNGDLHCHRFEDGEVIWRRSLLETTGMNEAPEWGFSGSPLLVEDQLFVEAGATLSLNPKTGEVNWRSQPFRPSYGTPHWFSDEGGERLAALKTDGLVVLDALNGGTLAFQKWETPFQTNATTPIVNERTIFVSTGYDRGCALFQFDGRALTKRYENQLLCTHMNNAVLFDGHLYGFDGTAHRGRPTEFVCLELQSGKERWRVPPNEGLGCGSLIASADGKLIVLSERGELVIATASPSGFEELKRGQILGGRCWTPPAMAGGRIFARNSKGDLVCVGQ